MSRLISKFMFHKRKINVFNVKWGIIVELVIFVLDFILLTPTAGVEWHTIFNFFINQMVFSMISCSNTSHRMFVIISFAGRWIYFRWWCKLFMFFKLIICLPLNICLLDRDEIIHILMDIIIFILRWHKNIFNCEKPLIW